jgi:hypothetical protein
VWLIPLGCSSGGGVSEGVDVHEVVALQARSP